jgi:hypothetical protein
MNRRFSRPFLCAIFVLCAALLTASVPAQSQSFTISPSSINFKSVNVGMETGVTEITITNTGTTNLVISAFTITPFNVFILEYGWTRSLHKGQAGMWAIRFKPIAAGLVTGQIAFTIQGVSQPQIVTLSGTGTTTTAVASLSSNVLTFPDTAVGTTSTQTVTITNTGTKLFKLSAITMLPPFSQTGFTSLVTIQPKKSFSFQVTFTPTMAQTYANAISLTYDTIPVQTISVAGSATPPTGLVISSFPTLPTGSKGYAYLANLSATGGTPPYTWSLASGTLPTGLTLNTSGSLSGPVNVTTVGNYSFTLQVADSSSTTQTASMAMTIPVSSAASACNNISWNQSGTSVPEVDLPDLGTGTYMGSQGGLYPGGSNDRPADHEADGLALASEIVPLDANGNFDPNGKYVLLSIGVSISRTLFTQFQLTEQVDPTLNPNLVIVDGAIDGTDSPNYANFNDGSWQTILNYYLPYQNVTAQQVVAIWLNDPRSQPSGVYPTDMVQQENDMIAAIQNMQIYFPNLKLAYLESMHYGGYATNTPIILPEPYAYETGFAVQTVIADQINGQANLNYNPNNGPVVAPWLSWGTYDWANGMTPNGNALAGC